MKIQRRDAVNWKRLVVGLGVARRRLPWRERERKKEKETTQRRIT
jgi:hypothetical protein